FPPDHYRNLEDSLTVFLTELDEAYNTSNAPPDDRISATEIVHTGHVGRPRIEIDKNILEYALQFSGPARLGKQLGCCSRTVRRRALEHELCDPQPPVRTTVTHDDGSVTFTYTSYTAPMSTITDQELDDLVSDILQQFPAYGRRRIKAALAFKMYKVPDTRIRESTLVIHCFIDGYSRLVLGIRVNTDNESTTVLRLFRDCVRLHGLPSRYISSPFAIHISNRVFRSVHNTRIERLWFDVTKDFGGGWKRFARDLQDNEGFD
ncbi:hypothetical protein SISSUDRAFT_957542, partial [Sistotremastrum suecicum HHB10207 ss-3]